jgi:valyl-tRNA synthetase
VLKVTPSHDHNDYSLGKKHELDFINILNKDGSMNDRALSYAGLDRFECRKKLIDDLSSQGFLLQKVPTVQRVPRSQRGGEVIEPMLSSQWFVKTKNMAERAKTAVVEKQLQILPERFEKVWFHWLDNIHDWCISRQLWWGHR